MLKYSTWLRNREVVCFSYKSHESKKTIQKTSNLFRENVDFNQEIIRTIKGKKY